jgi:hypothetical protein
MDGKTFERVTRCLVTSFSRRGIWRGAAGTALGAAVVWLPFMGAARKKRKNAKNSKLKLNAFGCVNVGGKCRGNSANCCSGICDGKKPKKGEKDKSRCVAHDVSTCLAGQDTCESGLIPCGANASCSQTTGRAPFCAGPGDCVACRKDTDCQTDFGAGAACIVCSDCEETGTACVPAAP